MTSRKIFVNYRRADHRDFVERIRDWFVMRYGRESVFMDFDTIPPFTRFADYIRERVRQSDVLVTIIGPRWVDILHERAQNADEDYVRTEIKLALDEGKLIAPICIKGATMPTVHELPPDLRAMLAFNAAHLDSGAAFLDNIQLIMNAVEQQLTESEGWAVFDRDYEKTVGEPDFDIIHAIDHFQKAADRDDWYAARDWLRRIRASQFVPRFYPIDDYEREVREQIKKLEAERDYQIIRMMAERALQGREVPRRVWNALQMFWEEHPGYDPDNIAATFKPIPPPQKPPERIMLEPIADFDPTVLDAMEEYSEDEVEALLGAEELARVAASMTPESDAQRHAARHPDDNRPLSYDDAQERGLVQIDEE